MSWSPCKLRQRKMGSKKFDHDLLFQSQTKFEIVKKTIKLKRQNFNNINRKVFKCQNSCIDEYWCFGTAVGTRRGIEDFDCYLIIQRK